MTYAYCKQIIAKGGYDRADMLEKLDVFLLSNRITKAQHNELVGMVEAA